MRRTRGVFPTASVRPLTALVVKSLDEACLRKAENMEAELRGLLPRRCVRVPVHRFERVVTGSRRWREYDQHLDAPRKAEGSADRRGLLRTQKNSYAAHRLL